MASKKESQKKSTQKRASQKKAKDKFSVFAGPNPIVIDDPPEGTSSGLSEIPIKAGCKIDASGHVDGAFNNLLLQKVWGRIGTTEIPGTATSYTTWIVNDIPEAYWNSGGYIQTVHIRGEFYNQQTAGYDFYYNQREFISHYGYDDCESYYYTTVSLCSRAVLPIQETMPRHFRVTAAFGDDKSRKNKTSDCSSPEGFFLSYDQTASTPECPVWRDVGLPSGIGGWLLRVIRTGASCHEAQLSFQPVTETSVMPPAIFRTRSWCFRKKNLMHGSLKTDDSERDVTLTLEPA